MSAARDESDYNLGELKHEFYVSRGALVMHVFVLVLCVGLLGAAGGKNWAELVAPKDASAVMLYLGLAAAVGGTYWGGAAIVRYIRGRDVRLLLFADGFVCHRAGKVTSCRWDEVDVVHEEITRGSAGRAPVYYRRLSI